MKIDGIQNTDPLILFSSTNDWNEKQNNALELFVNVVL